MAWRPTYVSLALMRDWLRINDPTDTSDDALLRLKLGAASRAVDKSCGRQFGKAETAVSRKYDVRYSRTREAYVAEIDDIMDTTGFTLTLDGTALVVDDDYELMPLNAAADGKPYTYVVISASPSSVGRLVGLGLWGWNAPYPDPIVEATMLQASRLNIRRDSAYGIAGGDAGAGELRLLSRLDPDIAPLVADYVRTGWVAK